MYFQVNEFLKKNLVFLNLVKNFVVTFIILKAILGWKIEKSEEG